MQISEGGKVGLPLTKRVQADTGSLAQQAAELAKDAPAKASICALAGDSAAIGDGGKRSTQQLPPLGQLAGKAGNQGIARADKTQETEKQTPAELMKQQEGEMANLSRGIHEAVKSFGMDKAYDDKAFAILERYNKAVDSGDMRAAQQAYKEMFALAVEMQKTNKEENDFLIGNLPMPGDTPKYLIPESEMPPPNV